MQDWEIILPLSPALVKFWVSKKCGPIGKSLEENSQNDQRRSVRSDVRNSAVTGR